MMEPVWNVLTVHLLNVQCTAVSHCITLLCCQITDSRVPSYLLLVNQHL